MVTMSYSPRADASPVMNFIWIGSQVAVIVGAINWGLIALSDYNLVEHLFGAATLTTRSIYSIVGLSGIMQFIRLVRFLVDALPAASNTTTTR
jgi:uncharacterized membrane protein YuzA (DUF378 family)